MLILGWFKENLFAFIIWIVAGVYKAAAFVFQIFLVLSTNDLIPTKTYEQMYSNFYAVLGVVILFFLAFSFLKAMVNPEDDKVGTTAVKNIIINLVTSTIIMALLPTIFGFLYDVQHSILVNQNTIGRFFNYGAINSQADSENNTSQIKRGSFQIANGIFTAFFNADMESKTCKTASASTLEDCQKAIIGEVDGENVTLKNAIDHVDSFGKFGVYTGFAENIDNGEVDYQWLLSLAGGVALLYVGISYCFDMALRLVKLVFYQLIAPIPIFARVIPDTKLSGSFNDWLKVTLACYFEVYVRIFTLYFVVFLCTTMLKSGNFLSDDIFQYGFFVGLFGRGFILMGIVMFMKQAPKLISEVTGIDTGNMKLGIREKLKDGGFFTAGAAVGAGVTALTRNAFNVGREIKNNWKKSNGWQRAGLVARAVGSPLTGGFSGFVRGGRAGTSAGSFRDMSTSARTGAQGAVDARNARADRNTRYQAAGNRLGRFGATGFGGVVNAGANVIAGRAIDVGEEISDWATGGTDRYAGQIKTADEMTGSYDAIDAAASKIYEKYKHNLGIKAQGVDFKGDAATVGRLRGLETKYSNASMATIESELENLRTADISVDKEKFMKTSALLGPDGKRQTYFDEKGYKQEVERRRIEHAQSVADMESFVGQLKKDTLLRIQAGANGELATDGRWVGANVGDADAAGVKSAVADFEARFKANGASVTDPIEPGNSRSGELQTAKDRKKAADAYKNVGNEAKQKSAALRLRAEQRNNDK